MAVRVNVRFEADACHRVEEKDEKTSGKKLPRRFMRAVRFMRLLVGRVAVVVGVRMHRFLSGIFIFLSCDISICPKICYPQSPIRYHCDAGGQLS